MKIPIKFKQIAVSSGQVVNSPDWLYGLDENGQIWIAETNTRNMEWTKLEPPYIEVEDPHRNGPF